MKIFFAKKEYGESYAHLLVSYSWEQNHELQNTQFGQLATLRAQFFCEDVGHLHYRIEKFTIEPYDRDKHLKKMCPACVLKAKRSKRYGPQIAA